MSSVATAAVRRAPPANTSWNTPIPGVCGALANDPDLSVSSAGGSSERGALELGEVPRTSPCRAPHQLVFLRPFRRDLFDCMSAAEGSAESGRALDCWPLPLFQSCERGTQAEALALA